MKKDFVNIAIALMALIFCGAGEELLPKALGAGVPLLLSAAMYFAVRRSQFESLAFAVAAGLVEDSLSSLPFATSTAFFVAAAAVMRAFKLPLAAALASAPAYQLWIWVWLGPRMAGSVFMRFAAALPTGAAALLAVASILLWLDGKAAVDEN